MDKSDRDISQWDARLKEQLERSFHNYHKRRIDLSVARDNKQLNWTGETLIVEKASSSSAIATVRLMFEDADPLTLEENVEIESIFNRLYLSNNAQADEWLDVIAGINFEYKKKIAKEVFVDRGDPADIDFLHSELILDGAWHSLDLSNIIPKGCVLVLLRVANENDVAGSAFDCRKYGCIYQCNFSAVHCFVSNMYNNQDVLVIPDKNGVIEYLGNNQATSGLSLVVGGWWI